MAFVTFGRHASTSSKRFSAGDSDQHALVTDQRDRIERGHVTHIDVLQIARRQVKVRVDVFGDDQARCVSSRALSLARRAWVFGVSTEKVSMAIRRFLADQFGSDTAQRPLIHLAIHLLRMVLRTRRKSGAAATPQRAAATARTRAPRTLLLPRFLAAAADFGARQLLRACLAGRPPGTPPRPGAPALR